VEEYLAIVPEEEDGGIVALPPDGLRRALRALVGAGWFWEPARPAEGG